MATRERALGPQRPQGTPFTCFTGTNVQTLTCALLARHRARATAFTAFAPNTLHTSAIRYANLCLGTHPRARTHAHATHTPRHARATALTAFAPNTLTHEHTVAPGKPYPCLHADVRARAHTQHTHLHAACTHAHTKYRYISLSPSI